GVEPRWSGGCLPAAGCVRRRGGLPPCRRRQVRPLLDDPAGSRLSCRLSGPLQSLCRRGARARRDRGMKPLLPRQWGLIAALAALILDQATKVLMLYGLHFKDMLPGQAIPVF